MVRSISTLKKRRDFLACARARRWSTPGFLLQGLERKPDDPVAGVRLGYTCSKKVGNAVTRNRAKRRLRAIAREVFSNHGNDGWDYVLVGRAGTTVSRQYAKLVRDLETAVHRVHAPPKKKTT